MYGIVGLSGRGIVESSFSVGPKFSVFDIFGDRETIKTAECWYDVGLSKRNPLKGNFDRTKLFSSMVEFKKAGGKGWIMGSGFESHSIKAHDLSRVLPLIGNSPDVFDQVSRTSFFLS